MFNRRGTVYPNWYHYYVKKYTNYLEGDIKKGRKELIDYTFEEFVKILVGGKCHYCGNTRRLGLDRIDNTKGHTKANTLVACCECNLIRKDRFTVKQMEEISKYIQERIEDA